MVFFCLLLILVALPVVDLPLAVEPLLWASESTGESCYPFLKLNMVSYSAGLGEVSSPLSDHPDAVFVAPSAAPFQEKSAFFIAYNKLYADISSGQVGYYTPMDDNSSVGGNIKYVSYGKMTKTDEVGEELGEFSAQSLGISGFYSRAVLKHLALSGTVTFIYEGIDDYNSVGIAMDIGGLMKFSRGRGSVGFQAKNLGFQLKGFTEQHKDPLPVLAQLGGNWNPKGLPLKLYGEVEKSLGDPFVFKVGTSIKGLDPLMAELGYTVRQKVEGEAFKDDEKYNGLSFGAGLKLEEKNLLFHYAYSSYGLLGATHKISISFNRL